ncbi:MAG: glycoside hydrolase family 18 [Rikenellaceae bacterium]|jgi:hypothetical protein|nr:glycoside hydrolase family 18 [Rikenellaceae bacterium]
MRTKICLFTVAFGAALASCSDWTKQENVQIQKPYEYEGENAAYGQRYYEDLRAYKQSPHEIFYGWFAGYANREGQENEPAKQPASFGERFLGLPDSMDVCSCWGGIPTLEKNPIAYNDMRYVRRTKGIRMLNVTICRITKRNDADGNPKYSQTPDSASVRAYAAELLAEVWVRDESGESYVDGLDLDYEPDGDWLTGNWFLYFVKEIGKSIGPMAETEEGRKKLLVVDFYSVTPPSGTEPYVNYYIRQAYTQGFTTHSYDRLQSGFNSLASWMPVGKYVVTENYGEFWATGGSPCETASGSGVALARPDGSGNIYSIELMARWRPAQGRKGGFGAFYLERDYQNAPGYRYIRNAIQIANPAIVK